MKWAEASEAVRNGHGRFVYDQIGYPTLYWLPESLHEADLRPSEIYRHGVLVDCPQDEMSFEKLRGRFGVDRVIENRGIELFDPLPEELVQYLREHPDEQSSPGDEDSERDSVKGLGSELEQ